jgi:LPXTG-motif cell wall-anchored protein
MKPDATIRHYRVSYTKQTGKRTWTRSRSGLPPAYPTGFICPWKLTAYRMSYSDYEIGAKSRKTNNWAFIVSGIIVLAAIGSFFFKKKQILHDKF